MFYEGGLVLRPQTSERKRVEQLVQDMLEESQTNNIDHELSIQISLIQLLIWSRRLIFHQQDKSLPDIFHPTLREIVNWVSTNFRDSRLTLEQITQQFPISKYYFCRLFKQHTSYTFSQYVNLLRVREAQKLLRESDIKVIEIANQTGFESIHHFCRVFKNISQMPPLAYRKSNRQVK